MSASLELDQSPPADLPVSGVLGTAQRLLDRLNALLMAVSALAAAAAGGVLTWEVAGRYFFKIPSDWQDELSIFLLVGATFLSAGWIQARRGHVGIDALQHILPSAAERARRILADVVSLAFCGFFCWRCWALLWEAWEDGQTTDSAWGPPLSIPYGLMAFGMSVLVLQLALQVLAPFSRRR
ncbi:MAG TPA: TRAP transporter small permease [Stellaceae bacterium]|nr:TRAP transporter small permease [Stellaceae bacterium]